jgi:hypothetical protein
VGTSYSASGSKQQTVPPSHTPDPSRRLPGALNAHGVKIVFHMQGIELETLRTQARQTMVPPEPPWPLIVLCSRHLEVKNQTRLDFKTLNVCHPSSTYAICCCCLSVHPCVVIVHLCIIVVCQWLVATLLTATWPMLLMLRKDRGRGVKLLRTWSHSVKKKIRYKSDSGWRLVNPTIT